MRSRSASIRVAVPFIAREYHVSGPFPLTPPSRHRYGAAVVLFPPPRLRRTVRHALLPAAALLAFAVFLSPVAPFAPVARADTGPDAVARELEQMRDAGQVRALAPAQARYREALAALKAGNAAEGQRLLAAASDLDPAYPDPHFTLAGVLAFRNPERTVGELGEGFRIIGRNYS